MLTAKDTSLSNLDLAVFRTVESDRMFYDQYQYCVLFRQPELSAIRGLDNRHIESVINMRNRWRTGSSSNRPRIGQDVVEQLHKTCRFLKARQDRFKIIFSFEYGYLYTNDTDIIEDIINLPYVSIYELKKVVVTRPKDTVVLKNPKHSQRSFMKNRNVTPEQRIHLRRYFDQRDSIRPGPGFRSWLEKSELASWNYYVLDYFFFDHNDDGELLMFQLAFPGIIRKTIPIVAK